jgi:hypothetical protein
MAKSNKAEIKEDVVNILNHVTETLFYFFEDTEEDLDDDDEALDEFTNFIWIIANVAMASVGMTITGRNSDGTINAVFNPVKSVKEFLQNDYTGDDGDRYFEDMVSVDEESSEVDLGSFEGLFIGEDNK